jgi:DNA repair exonuclease SbcCD ATPase subunit
MIEQLTIQNFQSHKDSTLNFDPGVNVIIGNSDSGKTAILRALRWLINNRPLGNEFRSNWGGETVVAIETDNETISLSIDDKGKDKTYNWDGSEFKAFGTDIPEEIKQALNISEINLQTQFDQPFLLSSSPGEIAAHFNKIAHIDQIDKANRNVTGWINNINSVIGHDEEKNRPASGLIKTLKELESQLAEFTDLEKFEIELEVLEGMKERWQEKVNKLAKLKSLITSTERTEKEIETTSNVLEFEKPVNDLLSFWQQWEESNFAKKSLSKAIFQIKETDKRLQEVNTLIQYSDNVNELLKLYKEQDNLIEVKNSLNKTVSAINRTNTLFERESGNLTLKIALFKKEMPNECPLCGSKTIIDR